MAEYKDTLCKELGICDDVHALLWEYACGTLDRSYSLLIESFLDIKPQARKVVTQFETIGGAMLEKSCAPSRMAEDSLSKVLAAMDCSEATAARNKPDAEPSQQKLCKKSQELPPSLQFYINDCGHKPRWNKMVPGMAFCKLPGQDGRYTITILEAKPGTKVPDHQHKGTEVILVLSGAFYDENGTYTQGDIIINNDQSHHEPTVPKDCDGACICLIVADNPMQFTGPLTRLLNIFKL